MSYVLASVALLLFATYLVLQFWRAGSPLWKAAYPVAVVAAYLYYWTLIRVCLLPAEGAFIITLELYAGTALICGGFAGGLYAGLRSAWYRKLLAVGRRY